MCYNTFINYPKLQFLKQYFYFVFIDFPFMLPSASSVAYNAPHYDMKLLAQDVSQVIDQLGYVIKFVIQTDHVESNMQLDLPQDLVLIL
jgi:pimeloyl-ACP methyl ester carboxylesterase